MRCPFDDGRALGTAGSESGTIARDEEHDGGARITLERDAASAPFAITCGIYGCMAHTRFFSNEVEAVTAFEEMKHGLERILRSETEGDDISDSIADFVARFS
jgi:hypothetical protein